MKRRYRRAATSSGKVCFSTINHIFLTLSRNLVQESPALTSTWRRRGSSRWSRREKILADSASERLASSNLFILDDNEVLHYTDLLKVFGELAILYNCKRTASVRAAVEGRVWALERKVFQHIMVTSGIERIENQVSQKKSREARERL